MKSSLVVCASPFVVGIRVSLGFANPDMLPKHPGYPMGKSMDSVKGQPLTNDPDQKNASGENSLVESRYSTMFIRPSIFQSIRTINGCLKNLEQEFFQRFRNRISQSNCL
ncbi:MAG: hypothetical protein ABI988_17985 [Nitrospirota bacterium]